MKLTPGAVLHLFTNYCDSRGYSPGTKDRYLRESRYFFWWLEEEKNKTDLRDITGEDIMDYQHYLLGAKTTKGKPFGRASIRGMVFTVAHLFRVLVRNELVISNPFDYIEITMQKEYKERHSIPEGDLHKVLDRIEPRSLLGIRDRAIFELMYATGLRVGEVVHLDVTDVDLTDGKLFVREGKGGKDRIVPLGKNTIEHLRRYLSYARPLLAKPVKDSEDLQAFFLTQNKRRATVSVLGCALKRRFKDAGLSAKVSPHMLRHSFATHMLEHGADLKSVKDILGHESMETTAIYTHVNVNNLKKLVKQFHPRENELYEEFSIEE